MLNPLRPAMTRVFTPVGKLLARTPVTPNAVTVIGTVGVAGTVWYVRMPRLPKLPPKRASAVDTSVSENAVNSTANKAESRNQREPDIVVPIVNDGGNVGAKKPR